MASPFRFPSSPISRSVTAALLLAYFVLATVWTETLGHAAPTSLISPASGIGLALVLLRGPHVLPLIFAASLAHALLALQPGPPVMVIAQALSVSVFAAVEPLIAALLIRLLAGEAWLQRARPFALAMLVAVPAATFLAALLPSLIQEMPSGLTAARVERGFLAAWYSAATSDLMGMIALAPPICIWAAQPQIDFNRARMLELGAMVATAMAVLVMPIALQTRYLLVALHIVVALRFPLKWSAAAVALSSLTYLALSTTRVSDQPPDAWYVLFLGHVAFIIILNLATYVTALLHTELRNRASQLAELARALGQAEESERRKIAQILHDHHQQLLVAAKLALNRRSDPDLDRARRLVDDAIESARTLMVELHPRVLDDEGLPAALNWLGWHVHDLTGLDVEVDADPDANPASPEIRAFLFQATRELLTNVVKHAETERAWLSLRRSASRVQVRVEDHGKGCAIHWVDGAASNADRRHYGLPEIRERIELLGGVFDMRSDGGCVVTLSVPMASRNA